MNTEIVVRGVAYSEGTPDQVIECLERLYRSDLRVVIEYGDRVTGRYWGEHQYAPGTDGASEIGRVHHSTGKVPICIIVHNHRSMGGGAILTGSIVRIYPTNKKDGTRDLYRHPLYHETTAQEAEREAAA